MAAAVKEVFIVGAKRTAFGKFGGALSNVSSLQLGTEATKAALSAAKVNPELIDGTVFGNVLHSSAGSSGYLARHISLDAGIPIPTPALLINRLCGSGFESVVYAARQIMLGDGNLLVAGGVEHMTNAPFVIPNIRFGTKLGVPPVIADILFEGLYDHRAKVAMGITAENLAEKYNITREESEQFAYNSQQKWLKAHKEGLFKAEIAPISIIGKKKTTIFEVDEHPRPETTLEQMAKLATVFKKNGTVTAGTASGINDGAGAIILASAQAVKDHNLTPLARIVSYETAGCPPEIMGIGPVSAVQGVLRKSGLTKSDIDFLEINEAFAPQVLACNRELQFDTDKLNTCGGAVAVGHPLAASGSRIMAHITHKLQSSQKRYAIGSACIGGGQGIAILIERC